MTRLMGDATHSGVPVLATRNDLQLVGGYVTGSPDIIWTNSDWSLFPPIPRNTIDQGFTGSPVMTAITRDVENGAWGTNAVDKTGWTVDRPTIYCNRDTLPSILNAGWRGDLWLAIPGWTAGELLPNAPGCTIVAVQNEIDVQNAYDLSIVLDDTWPMKGDIVMPSATTQDTWKWCVKCSALFYEATARGNVCPAGGQHDGSQSNDYSMLFAK